MDKSPSSSVANLLVSGLAVSVDPPGMSISVPAPTSAVASSRCAGNGGAPGRIRTCDTRFRKPLLSPLSYEGGGWQNALRNATVERGYTAAQGPETASRGGLAGRLAFTSERR